MGKDDVILLQRHIKKDSVLITDGNRTYRNLHDIKLKSLKFGKPENKVYHLNNINNFHSMLKKFMIRFNGVATKYLDYYVSYFQSMKSKIDVFNTSLFAKSVNGLSTITGCVVVFIAVLLIIILFLSIKTILLFIVSQFFILKNL